MRKLYLLIFCLLGLAGTLSAQSDFRLRLYPQVAVGANNDIRCPNNSDGTLLSLPGDLHRTSAAVFAPRVEFEYAYRRHHIMLAAVFVRENFTGHASEPIHFNQALFATGSSIDALYRFDTYRLSYRYRLVNRPKFQLELGATALLRDAMVAMTGDNQHSEFYNLGVVPLISYYIGWTPISALTVYSYGDGLVSKYGRAEDIFAGVKYDVHPNIGILAGYRLIEGGQQRKERLHLRPVPFSVDRSGDPLLTGSPSCGRCSGEDASRNAAPSSARPGRR